MLATLKSLELRGPISLTPDPSCVNVIEPVSGVYLWCVRTGNESYLVHYVGEAKDIRSRTRNHIKKQLDGQYVGFDPCELAQNIKILVHRAGVGVIDRYKGKIDADDFNRRFVECMNVFYADLGENADKETRCRYESALYRAVEESGQNILNVRHIRWWDNGRIKVKIDSGSSVIVGLTGATIDV